MAIRHMGLRILIHLCLAEKLSGIVYRIFLRCQISVSGGESASQFHIFLDLNFLVEGC